MLGSQKREKRCTKGKKDVHLPSWVGEQDALQRQDVRFALHYTSQARMKARMLSSYESSKKLCFHQCQKNAEL